MTHGCCTHTRSRSGSLPHREQFHPPMDIREESEAYFLTLELPGVAREEIKIDLKGDTLSISGEKKEYTEDGEGYRESMSGKFKRVLRVKEGIDAEKISSSLENGVLTVTLPKSEAGKAKRIDIA